MSKKIFLLLPAAIVVLMIAGYFIYKDANFSKGILRLEIQAPESTDMGKEIEYAIKYKNNGNFNLEKPKLTFYMPENSLTEDGKTIVVQNLSNIIPGEEGVIKIKTRLLGKEGDLKTAKAVLAYTPRNLTVRYESETSFTTKIEIVPISLDFNMPSKAEKDGTTQFSIKYFSYIDYPLENVSLKVQPVQGLEFVSSLPSSLDHAEWKLPTLTASHGGEVSITENVTGQINNQLNINAQLGVWKSGKFIVIKESNATLEISQPSISILQSAFYDDPDFKNTGPVPPIAEQETTYTINWSIKNYSNDIKNVKVQAVLPQNVSLTGKILPEDEARNFSFDSVSRQITWSAGDILAGTGVKGDPYSVSFQVSLMPNSSQKGFDALLVGAATITAKDQSLNTVISSAGSAVSASGIVR